MARTLLPCPSCAELVPAGTCTCAFCGATGVCKAHHASRAALLLGLALAGCAVPPFGGEELVQADYSAAVTEDDDDQDDGFPPRQLLGALADISGEELGFWGWMCVCVSNVLGAC